MSIRASNPERTDARSPRCIAVVPFAKSCIYEERTICKIDVRVWCLKMQTRRDQSVLEREHGFDQTRNTSRGVEMTDICLHRSQRAKLFLLSCWTIGLLQRGDLNRIAERCAGAMSFD